MAQSAPARTRIATTGPRQAWPPRWAGAGPPHGTRPGRRERDRARGHPGRRRGDRAGVRDYGVPGPREQGRWRAVWYEDGERQQCEAVSEVRLAARLEKVTERLGPARRTWSGPART